MSISAIKIKKWIGFVRCAVCLLGWNIRDVLINPKETAVCFVAHPDDETLFFYHYLKEKSPYVVVLTGCSSFHRLSSLKKTMKKLGLRFRAYPLNTDHAAEESIKKIVKRVMRRGSYTLCATHNAEGEYGHLMHCRVHQAVVDLVRCPVYVPASDAQIEMYPLPVLEAEEKLNIFRTYYASEDFVPELFGKWIINEHLVIENDAEL